MSNMILNPALAAILSDVGGFHLEREVDGGVSVGGKVALPFGGRLSDESAAKVEQMVHDVGVSVGAATPSDGGLAGMLRQLGAIPCRMWGKAPPGNCCTAHGEIDPCKARGRICGDIGHYYVPITSDAQTFDLKPNGWFRPILLQDASDANVYWSSLKFANKEIGPFPSSIVYPSELYGSTGSMAHNAVLGWPAIDNNQGLSFTLHDASGANDGTAIFAGKIVGLSEVST